MAGTDTTKFAQDYLAGSDLKLLGPGMPEPGMSPFGGHLKQLQERYAELDAAAAAEPDAVRRAQLLSARDAVESESLQTELASRQPAPARVDAGPPPPQQPAAPQSQPGPGSDMPVPTIGQWAAMSGSENPGNPALRSRAYRELGNARTDEQQGYQQQIAAVESLGNNAEATAEGQASVIHQSMQDLAAQEQRHQEQLAKAQQDKAAALSRVQAAEDDFERERAAQGKSVEETWGEGRKIAAAIAMAMGAFGAAINGGPNHAAEIINARINREVEARRERLSARRDQASAADRHYQRLVAELGSVDAADAASKAHLLQVAALKTDELGALSTGQEGKAKAQQMSGDLKVRAAGEREKAAEAAVKAARGAAGANAAKLYSSYLDMLSKFARLRKDEAKAKKEAGAAADDYLDSDARKRINQIDVAEEQLNSLEARALDLKAKGVDALPGEERFVAHPLLKVGRAVGGATGLGGVGATGLDPREANLMNDVKMFAVSSYFAEGNNAANLQSEYERAFDSVAGNRTVDSLLLNLAVKRDLYKAQRAAVVRKNTPELREEQRQHHIANQPTIPSSGGYTPAGGRPRGAVR